MHQICVFAFLVHFYDDFCAPNLHFCNFGAQRPIDEPLLSAFGDSEFLSNLRESLAGVSDGLLGYAECESHVA